MMEEVWLSWTKESRMPSSANCARWYVSLKKPRPSRRIFGRSSQTSGRDVSTRTNANPTPAGIDYELTEARNRNDFNRIPRRVERRRAESEFNRAMPRVPSVADKT